MGERTSERKVMDRGVRKGKTCVQRLWTTRTDQDEGIPCSGRRNESEKCRRTHKTVWIRANGVFINAYFTTYRRHHRHPVGYRRQRTSVRTGTGLSYKRGHFRSHADHPFLDPGSDRVDRRRSRTWIHRMCCPRNVAALVPAKNR